MGWLHIRLRRADHQGGRSGMKPGNPIILRGVIYRSRFPGRRPGETVEWMIAVMNPENLAIL